MRNLFTQFDQQKCEYPPLSDKGIFVSENTKKDQVVLAVSQAEGSLTYVDGPGNHSVITRLSRGNHPLMEGVWKYVACMLLAFTLGVGQMWGADPTWSINTSSAASSQWTGSYYSSVITISYDDTGNNTSYSSGYYGLANNGTYNTNYVELYSTTVIDSVSFLIAANGDSKSSAPNLVGWEATTAPTSGAADFFEEKSITLSAGYSNAQWVQYNVSAKSLHRVRLYRAVTGITVGGTSKSSSTSQTIRVWGAKVWLHPAASTPRTFKSGEKIYFKDVSSNLDIDCYWKVPSGNVYAWFMSGGSGNDRWSTSYGVPVEGDWNGAGTIYELVVPQLDGVDHEWGEVCFTRGSYPAWDSQTWDKTTNQSPDKGKNLFYLAYEKYADHIYYGSWGNFTPADKTIYFDARIAADTWTTPYVRLGHATQNVVWGPMTKVAGTKCLYSQTSSKWSSHTDFSIANKAGWSGSNNIDQPEATYSNDSWSGSEHKMTMQTNYQQYAIDSNTYICPKATSVLEHECQFYQITDANSTTSSRIDANTKGMRLPQYTVTASGTNCTVALAKFTSDPDAVSPTTSNISSGDKVDPTQYVKATVTPTTGYQFSSVSLTENAYEQKTAAAAGTPGVYAILANCTISASCTPITYSISYLDGGGGAFSGVHIGTAPDEHTYATATALKKACKAGYVFGGWYTDSKCTSSAGESLGATAYTDDITLYAKWTAISMADLVSGTFYGASAMVPADVTVGGSEQAYPGVSSDQRFNMLGSSTSEAMASKTMSSTPLTNADAVTEYLDFKGTASLSTYTPSTKAVQFKIPAAGQLEVWANSGIYLSNGSSETSISPSSNYAIVTVAAGTYYLYAQNTSRKLYGIRYKKTHSVSAVTSTGTTTYGTVSASPTTVAEDSASIITAVPATGYQVTNWAKTSGTGASISPSGSSNSNTTTLTMGTTDATVTVTFGAIDYTITHSDPTGDGTYTISVAGGDETDDNTTANYGQTITLAATPGEGYEFTSWTVTGATSGDAITVTSNQFSMPAENVTVTATFTATATYTVTYNANGGTGDDVVDDAATTVADNTFTAPATKAFAGWNTKSDGKGTDYAVGDAVDDNLTLYAQWKYKVYYIGKSEESNDITAALATKYVVSVHTTTGTSYNASDYSDYALIVLSESLTGSNAGTDGHELKLIVGLNKPILNLKSYFYNSDRWNWGTPNAGKTPLKIYVKNDTYSNLTSHPIYTGLTPDGSDSIQILSSYDTGDHKPIQPIGSFTSGCEGYTLALVPNNSSGSGTAIHELTAAQRSTITSQSISSKYLLISIYSKDLSHLSTDGKTLIKNAADYLITGSQWVPQYTITYAKGSAGGASGDSFTGTKTHGTSFSLSSSTSAFTRSGYTYDGWSTSADGSTKNYNLGGSYTTDAAITLYPHWVLDCTDAELAYDDNEVEKTYGDAAFTNTLTNENSVSVTYSSTNTSVATVDSDGEVTIKAAGNTTIKATLSGDATYCDDEVSYTLTVDKADLSVSPAAGTATSVTHNSATLPFTLASTTGVASVTLKVYLNSDNSLVETVSGVTAATSGSGEVTGLDASTTYYFTVTPIGDANHNDGSESSKSSTFTTEATPTLTALVEGTLYEVPDMIPDGASLTSSDQFFEGLSANARFELIGSASGSTTPKVNNSSSNDKTIAGITFDDGSMFFKGNASLTSNTPTTFGLSFITPGTGKLYLYFSDSGTSTNIKLAKSGSSGSKPSLTNGYAAVDVTGGTYYLYGTNDSKLYSFYGMKFITTYDITLKKNNNDAGSTGGTAKAPKNGTQLIDLSAPTRTGYHIEGYYAEPACTSKVADDEGNFVANVTISATSWTDGDGKWVKGSGATLYAKWEADEYSVTYADNGKTSGSVPTDATTYHYGDEVEVADNTGEMAKTGYTFVGWTYNGTFYQAGDKITITEDVTLTAVWKSNSGTETIALTYFEGTNYSTSSSKPDGLNKYLYGYKSSTLTAANALTITTDGGTNIKGLNSNVELRLDYNQKIRIYADNATTDRVATGFSGVTTISFKWKFIASGNSGKDELTSSYTVKVGSTTVADAVSITGKTLDGYATVNITEIEDLDGYVEIYFAGSASKYNVYLDDISITFTQPIYSVSFNNMTGFGGTATLPDAIVGVPSGSKILQPADPTTEGEYVFGGWYKEGSCTNAWDFASDQVTSATTLYAKWYDADHTVTWKVNGETYATTKVSGDVDLKLPTPPADNTLGCANSFRGWSATNLYGEATSTQPTDLFITAAGAPTIDEDKTFYAVFGTATSAAKVGTVLWSENWTGAAYNSTPDDPSDNGSVVYGDARVGYTWVDGTGTGSPGTSKVYNGTDAGGVTPEAFIGKKGTGGDGGYLLVNGISVGSAKTVTVQYIKNSQTIDVSYYLDGDYSGHNEVKTSTTTGNFDIDCSGKSTLSLKFEATTTNNVRLDNIVVKVKEDGATNYRCICPSLTLAGPSGDIVFVTSTASKTVRSQEAFTVSGKGMTKSAALTAGTFGNSKFAFKTATGGTVSTDANGDLEETSVYVFYTPAADDDEDGLDEATEVTISIEGAGAVTSNNLYGTKRVIGRHLPADFVIAAKNTTNNKWYALPANMSGTGNPVPVEIAVDDATNPAVAYTATSDIYNLYLSGDKEKVQLGMKENVNGSSKSYALWANNSASSTDIGKNTGLAESSLGDNYKWLLTQTNTGITTNAQDAKYTISNPNNDNPLKAWFTAGGGPKWGLYVNGVSELRLIPWGENYTVTFEDGNTAPGSHITWPDNIEHAPSGETIDEPTDPTANGYAFVGWYKEAACTNAWNFASDVITQDTTLYAKWTACTISITADPTDASYTQNESATALSVTAKSSETSSGDELVMAVEYQWYSNEENSNEDGTEIPGATSASYTPSTALIGTIYYYCVVTNDCGSATSAAAAVTVGDSKSDPTAVWTIAEPTHGGKGFSFSVVVKQSDGSTLWDGTLTAAMLSASEDVVLSDVTVNNTTKTISGTYGVKASATSPVTFYLELPSTTNCAAATLSQTRSFTACSGTGDDGDTYSVPFTSSYSSSATGKPAYRCETTYGYISPELGASSVSLASQSYAGFTYYINSGRSSVLIATKVDDVKKIQIYLNANSAAAEVTNVYTASSYSTALKDYTELSAKTDFTVSYTDEDDNSSIAKGKNGYVELAFTTTLDEGTLVYVVLKKTAKYYGAKLTVGGGSSATITTALAWSNSQADAATVEKHEDDAEFTITATRSGDAANASLGEIRYSSSDTKVATVNATTGQVTIADGIDFGSDDYKTTTIKATLISSGCYKGAAITYTLQVTKNTCTEAAGTVTAVDLGCDGVKLTVSDYEDEASIQWYKDDVSMGESYQAATCTVTVAGTYYAVTHKTCDRKSDAITLESKALTATKLVDSWYVKNGRRTPDVALVQTEDATGFTVKVGESFIWKSDSTVTTGIGGCGFHLGEDGIIYLNGTKDNGAAPSDLVAGDATIKITATGCGGNTDELDITIKKQAATLKPSVAFVVDGTTRAKGGTATSVSTAKTSERALWTYLSSTFDLTGCNIYWSVDSKELREYYSQFDAILVTDDPNTQTKGAGGIEYVKAFGTLVDVRPLLTMEAYVGRYTEGGWHVYNATPTSPNPRQVEMKLECRNHEIFADVSAESDNVRTVTTVNGDEFWYITIVDTTQSPYHNTTKDYKDLPALQGFNPNAFSNMLGVGKIDDDKLQAGVERQMEPAARMMIIGIQNNAMGALTNEGKLIIKNSINYLLKTNLEEVDDCSNYFIGGADGDETNWMNTANWSKRSVPDFTTTARIMAPVVITEDQTIRVAQVDIVVGGSSSKLAEGEPAGKVTINPGGALVVGGTVNRAEAPHYGIDGMMPTTDEDLIIKADANHNAALILDNSSGLTGATVQMYSSSYWEQVGSKKKKYWSYVAVPIQEALIPDYFLGAFTYYYEEAAGWAKKFDGDYLYPFQAIGLSRDAAGIEHFWGPLVSTENRDIKLTKTSTGGGENLIANSWTAPIQIANFTADDFGDANATVYIYNTGDKDSYTGNTVTIADEDYTGSGTAGQWLGIPIGVAKLEEYRGLKVIPAMQTFEVDLPAEAEYGTETTLHLDYDRLVRGVDVTDDNLTEKLHAPKRRMSKNDGDVEAVMKVRVTGVHTLAEVWLIQDGAFNDEGFDNGWESYYALCDDRSPQLYAHSEVGNMGIIAKQELEGTILGFAPSRDGADYTFSFYYRGDEELYLNDLLTQTSTLIDNEETYAFTSAESGNGSRFIISRNPYHTPQITTGTGTVNEEPQEKVTKFIYNDKLYILYRGMIYDANGKLINRK